MRVGDQVAEQPQIERMGAGDIGLIRQAVGAWAIARVELIQLLVAEIGIRQVLPEEVIEYFALGVRHQVAMHGGQAYGRRAHALEKGFDPLVGALVAVLLPEALQEHRALAVGETGQVLLAAGSLSSLSNSALLMVS